MTDEELGRRVIGLINNAPLGKKLEIYLGAKVNKLLAARPDVTREAVEEWYLKTYNYKPSAVTIDDNMALLSHFASAREARQIDGVSVEEIDLVELNEAFAVQALVCIDELRLDMERTNVNGGAIAIGHPLGSTGARLMVTLLHEMERRKARYGLVTMCVGVGQGVATLVEGVEP